VTDNTQTSRIVDITDVDPIAVIKERQHLAAEEKARKDAEAAAQAAKDAQEMEFKQNLVPELVEQLLREIGELYELYAATDYPELEKAKIVKVIDHDAAPTPAPGPFGKQSWFRRLFRLTVPAVYRDIAIPAPTKEMACWEATYINLAGRRPMVNVYIDVQMGTVYANSFEGSILNMLTIDVLNKDELYKLTYAELTTLLVNLGHNKRSAEFVIKDREWKAENAAWEAQRS